ncbi:thioredoxin family protein [Patescibacteria group bacterium]|nr:thioredoxin family protein [Patescibacteria group bacterium]
MKPYTFLIAALVIIIAGGAYVYSRSTPNSRTDITPTPEITPVYNEVATGTPQKMSRYVTYSKAAFDAAKGKRRVYFFHAPWCPTCRPADAEFQAKAESIPDDVVLFKTDYDSAADLKKQYNVTYQHTFVMVDDAGREVSKWNGGGINELITNTK